MQPVVILARSELRDSLEQFLRNVAQRGSWVGGGSVAALGAGVAAALLEKLAAHAQLARGLRQIRRECVALIERDAQTFARVIRATRSSNPAVFQRSLKAATEVPCQVYERACAVRRAGWSARRTIKPRFQADLRCALAMAEAAQVSAQSLIETNLTWLNDRIYAKAIRRRLRVAAQPHAR